MDAIKEKVIDLLVEISGTKKVKRDLDLDLVNNGYLDSMGVVELLSELEDEFGVEIPIDDFSIKNFDTANKIIEYVAGNCVEEA